MESFKIVFFDKAKQCGLLVKRTRPKPQPSLRMPTVGKSGALASIVTISRDKAEMLGIGPKRICHQNLRGRKMALRVYRTFKDNPRMSHFDIKSVTTWTPLATSCA